mmetsp:Transcript_23396/g.68877  ORF Transcript_23396/g.68877 Transcript_23396/m.68877 type:complete len:283 (+) Transcript_23396:93-941(+)
MNDGEAPSKDDFWGALPRVDSGGAILENQLSTNFKDFVSSLAHAVGVTTKATVANDDENNFVRVPYASLEKCAKKVFRAVAFEALVQASHGTDQHEHMKMVKAIYDKAWETADIGIQEALKWGAKNDVVDEPPGMPQSIKDLRKRARTFEDQEKKYKEDVAGLGERRDLLSKDIVSLEKQLEKYNKDKRETEDAIAIVKAEMANKTQNITASSNDDDALGDLSVLIESCTHLREELNNRKARVDDLQGDLTKKKAERHKIDEKIKGGLTVTAPGGAKRARKA